jgi:YjbE family integral membrane protein
MMDILSLQFLYALGAIILIDLVLAGDNAIVIALAARKLPPHLQKKAIMWGTVGAIAVRSLMTIVVVWLLKIPGLLLAGGALLLWIAVKLLLPNENDHEGAHGAGATTFMGAMKTIVIADAVMGLDNVLAVAGAAHGSFLLVMLGLLISIPIVVWGSTLILKWVERFPVIVYIGSGVLAMTAAKMMLSEPLIQPWVAPLKAWSWLLIAAVVAAVILIGYRLSKQPRSNPKIEGRLLPSSGAASNVATATLTNTVRPATQPLATASAFSLSATSLPRSSLSDQTLSGVSIMNSANLNSNVQNILLPVTASEQSIGAVRNIVQRHMRNSSDASSLIVHLLHVTPRFAKHVTKRLPAGARLRFLKDTTEGAIMPATKLLDQAGIQYQIHTVSNNSVAKTIIATAKNLGCSQIVVGSQRNNAFSRMLTNSVTGRLLATSEVPVEVVLHGEASLMQRWGLPAVSGAAMIALIAD